MAMTVSANRVAGRRQAFSRIDHIGIRQPFAYASQTKAALAPIGAAFKPAGPNAIG
jgi:hypothetical protein